jgi:ATP-dependent exoDNAse (exonuclease V) beta subunit
MTIHQSKGLEFPIVFVPEIGAGNRPDNSPVKYDDNIGIGIKFQGRGGESHNTLAFEEIGRLRRQKEDAESQRLFYVALTRARDYLALSGEGSGPWRSWIDEFAAGEGASLMTMTDVDDSLSRDSALAVLPYGDRIGHSEPVTTRLDVPALLPAVHRFCPSPPPRFYRCPRKYYYKIVLKAR